MKKTNEKSDDLKSSASAEFVSQNTTEDINQLSLNPPALQFKQSNTQSEETKAESEIGSNEIFQLASDSAGSSGGATNNNNTGLPDDLKTGVENLSGFSMDDVNVHYNSDKPAQLNAHAYAQGTDIHLGTGQEEHLPHEAWHVVQQKQGRVQPTTQLKGKVGINDDDGLEHEADVMGARALSGAADDNVNPNPQNHQNSNHAFGNSYAPVQRAKISADDIFTALQGTTFKQKKFENSKDSGVAEDTQISLDDILSNRSIGAQQRNGGQEKMKDRVKAIILEIESRFSNGSDDKTVNAMKIAVTIEGIAKVLADELYDMSLKPKIAKKLIESYRSELVGSNGFKQKTANKIPEALNLAEAMVSNDPVSMYMHDELDIDRAAVQIQEMATTAGITNAAMFKLQKDKFMAEMSSYTLKEVEDREDKAGKYNVKESTGELSKRYMIELFGDEFGGTDQKGKPNIKTSGELEFTTGSKSKIDDLEQKVSMAINPLTRTKTAEHLHRVQQDDQAMLANKEARVKAKLMTPQSGLSRALSSSEADTVINSLKAYMPNVPVTITVNSFDWFGKDTNADDFNPNFMSGNSRRNKANLDEVVGKDASDDSEDLDYLGRWNGQAERGEDYLRFRSWKDQKMTHNLGFEDDELPAFGALNVGFEKAKATEGVGKDYRDGYKEEKAKTYKYNKTKRAESKAKKVLNDEKKSFGINYYGDLHFKLNDNVKQRSIFTASDHGRPHTNPFLVFADYILKDDDPTDAYDGNVLKIKDSINKAAEANRMIAAALDGPKAIGGGLPFEVQIFGGVDLRQDLEVAYISPAVPKHVVKKMKSAFKKKGVNAPIVKTKKPKGLEVLKQYGEIKDEIFRILNDD